MMDREVAVDQNARRSAARLLAIVVPGHHVMVIFSFACALAILPGWLFGPGPVLRAVRVAWAIIIIGRVINLGLNGSCWVTDWENRLRARSGTGPTYDVPFLVHHLKSWPRALSQPIVLAIRWSVPALAPLAAWMLAADLGLLP